MENKTLGICIPTYNRSEKLNEMLSLLIEKIKLYNLPIFISDNDSKERTTEVVLNHRREYPYIYYSKNEKNLGPDQNFEIVLKMCTTKYAWLFGDDDYIITKNIDDLMIILNDNFDLVVVNFNKKVNIHKSMTFTDPNLLMVNLAHHMTYMTSLIISTKILPDLNFKKYYNSYFLQTMILFEYFAHNPFKVYFLHTLYVHSLPNRSSGWEDKVFSYFAIKFPTLILNLPDQYSINSKNEAIYNIFKKSVGSVRYPLVARIHNELNMKNIIKNRLILYKSFRNLGTIYLILLSLTPRSLAKLINTYALDNLSKIRKKIYSLIN